MSPTSTGESATTRPRVEGDRESEILVATLEVLADVGYDRLTMDAVATRAFVDRAQAEGVDAALTSMGWAGHYLLSRRRAWHAFAAEETAALLPR